MRFLPFFIYCFYRTLYASWRIRIEETPRARELIAARSPLILAHWHGDELALFHLVQRYGLATMTSTSEDGALVDYLIHRLGGVTSRGSSTRGGIAALKGLIRLCVSGRIVSMAVDGPRGPIYQPKPGVFELSKICGAHIIPVGVVAQPVFTFHKSWNKTYLPLPFARVSIFLGEPTLRVEKDMNAKDFELSKTLTNQLNAARQRAGKSIVAS